MPWLGVAGNYGFSAVEAFIRAVTTQAPEQLDAVATVIRLEREIDRTGEALRHLPQAQAA